MGVSVTSQSRYSFDSSKSNVPPATEKSWDAAIWFGLFTGSPGVWAQTTFTRNPATPAGTRPRTRLVTEMVFVGPGCA